MQNKQAVVGIVVAIVILLGAGGVFLLNKTKAPQTASSNSAPTKSTQESTMASGSISDLLSGGQNKKCTFDTKGTSGETKGTVYVSSDKVYGTFAMMGNNKTTNSYVIRNGDTFYIWGDAFPTGVKMTMSVEEMTKNMSGSKYSSSSFNPNEKVDYSCSDWSVDNSMFTPPANVKFQEMGNFTAPTGTTGSSSNPSNQCSLCSSLTGAAKTSCMSSFHCQ